MAPRRAPSIRQPILGGMALMDGVFIRSGLAWAIARADGTVDSGEWKRSVVSKFPGIRVLYSIWRALASAFRRAPGSRKRSRKMDVRLILVLLTPAVIGYVLGLFMPSAPAWAGSLALEVLTLALLKVLVPHRLWRNHGAEHKSIAAYEHGRDLAHIDDVARESRIHDRCGTNIVFIVFALAPFLSGLSTLLVLVFVAELVRYMGLYYSGSVMTRVVVTGGRALQRVITTEEPTTEELAVACRAVEACLATHDEVVRALVA